MCWFACGLLRPDANCGNKNYTLFASAKKKKKDFKVYVIVGDGENNEGSVWEAAMSAPNFKLDNLCVIIDKNNFQQTL